MANQVWAYQVPFTPDWIVDYSVDFSKRGLSDHIGWKNGDVEKKK
jgi:hypothetical protein